MAVPVRARARAAAPFWAALALLALLMPEGSVCELHTGRGLGLLGRPMRERGGALAGTQGRAGVGGGGACLRLRGAGEELRGFDREAFETVMKRRFFFAPSFQIHGGASGLYDYGPPGCAVKQSIVSAWRDHFVLEEGMLEVDCSILTPEPVLRASGHVQRFTDLMVRDEVTGDCYRADRLLVERAEYLLAGDEGKGIRAAEGSEAEALRRVVGVCGGMDAEELWGEMVRWGVKSPASGNMTSKPYPFNLMFNTSIGPSGLAPGFLRPETAQGIFTNFKKLLDFNSGRLPFAAAQVGKAFRNEIAPKQGLLRVREFEMAEIEHFVAQEDTQHCNFARVASSALPLLSRDLQASQQEPVAMPLSDAVSQGVIGSQNLAYFMARTHSFLVRCGVRGERIRFRQHLQKEMAHYARECWDAEVLCSYGWIEVVGHADRACYDLDAHARATGTDLKAFEAFEHPVEEECVSAVCDKQALGKTFRKEAKELLEELQCLAATKPEAAIQLGQRLEGEGTATLSVGGKDVEITRGMVSFEKTTRKVSGRSFTPSVIEPSFGIGRLLYCALEHAFYVREGDEQRVVLGLAPEMAPIKCCVLPLTSHDVLSPAVARVLSLLRGGGVSCKADESGAAIGRRYARMDELGVPFAVTVDFQSLEDGTATLRERDSMQQIRVPIDDVGALVRSLVSYRKDKGAVGTWQEAVDRHGLVEEPPERPAEA